MRARARMLTQVLAVCGLWISGADVRCCMKRCWSAPSSTTSTPGVRSDPNPNLNSNPKELDEDVKVSLPGFNPNLTPPPPQQVLRPIP